MSKYRVYSGAATMLNYLANRPLDDLNEKTIEEKWAWLSQYFEYTPHFFGFDIHVNKIIQDFLIT